MVIGGKGGFGGELLESAIDCMLPAQQLRSLTLAELFHPRINNKMPAMAMHTGILLRRERAILRKAGVG